MVGAPTWAAEPASEAPELEETVESPEYPPGYIEEAALPEGFPPPSAVGQVVEKKYPLCRTYSAPGNNAFMRCFSYLAKQKHEMTAPVIMDYKPKADASENQAADVDFMKVDRMHFILEKPSLDEPKQDGPVTVANMPQMRVLSIAYQGGMSAARIADAERMLEAEIERRKTVVATGPKRVLGYNSPMVPRDKSYWEVQIPIKERSSENAD
jgi:hypothetical protein